MRRSAPTALGQMRWERVVFIGVLSGASLMLGCAQWLERSIPALRSENLDQADQAENASPPNDQHSVETVARNDSQRRMSTTPARIIRFDGNHLLLGSTELPPLPSDKMMRGLVEPFAAGEFVDATQRICLFPEVYRQALLTLDEPAKAPGLMVFVATVLDGIERNPQHSGWAVFQQMRYDPSVDACIRARRQFVRELESGKVTLESERWLDATSQSQPLDLLRASSSYLLGMSQLLRNEPAAAFQSFSYAQEFGSNSSRAIESDACLMACEAARRMNDTVNHRRLFENAIKVRATQVSRSFPGADAPFWSRAQHLAPASFSLSGTDIEALEFRLRRFGLHSGNAEYGQNYPQWLLKATKVVAHFERGEFETALVGLKSLEGSGGQQIDEWMQFWQAKCLLLLGQDTVAIPILQRLAGNANGEVNAAARILLGGREIQSQKIDAGIQLVESGLQMQPARSTTLASGLADLGLAYLLSEQEPLGLNYLHQAQGLFYELGQHGELNRSLENEKQYFIGVGRQEEVARVQSELDRLNSSNRINSIVPVNSAP